MLLYRARPISSPRNMIALFDVNAPYHRARGRWFTSVVKDAVMHGLTNYAPGSWELVSVDVPDDIAETHRVETTPLTPCGLSPIEYAQKPQSEYVLPMFRVVDAKQLFAHDARNAWLDQAA